jgi:hypothetical protein
MRFGQRDSHSVANSDELSLRSIRNQYEDESETDPFLYTSGELVPKQVANHENNGANNENNE